MKLKLLILGLLAFPAIAAFPNGYSYCKVVTTQHVMVSGTADLANYPLAVVLTDTALRTVANGGLVNNGSGHDIGFGPDCSGSGTMLKWELDSYNATTGALTAHVLRPTLSHTVDDTIGMYYGGSFSSFQSTATAVWVGYAAVWHLQDPTAPVDSTSNANHLTNSGTVSGTGTLSKGATFAAGNYLVRGTNTAGFTQKPAAVSAWFNATSIQPHGAFLWDNATILGYDDQYWGIQLDGTTNKLQYYFYDGAGKAWLGSTVVTTNTWHHLAVVSDATSAQMWLDGVSQGTGATLFNHVGSAALPFKIGYWNNGTDHQFIGSEDEIRISSVARSSDWIVTEYRNQSAPGTYLSVGPQTSGVARVRHTVTGGE